MLAYVFWHERRADANDGAAYQRDAAEFQSRLVEARLDGFAGARTFAIEPLPWGDTSAAFEDWYLLRGSADLDELNDLAVSGARSAPHDRLAAAAAWGAGGLYRLRSGDARRSDADAQWFAKPAGMSFGQLDGLVASALSPEHALWQRQMVLGPAPEFCLTAPGLVALPPPFESRGVRRRLLAGITRTSAIVQS